MPLDSLTLDRVPLSERRSLTNIIMDALKRLTDEGDGKPADSPEFFQDQELRNRARQEILRGASNPANQFDAKALQNRDRSRQSYIAQMQDIAANPDYDRISTSRIATDGAPMVFTRGVIIPEDQTGKSETVTMSDGEGGSIKIPAIYAVIEAQELIASHNASGDKVEGYGGSKGIMALNNGRTAGIKQAYDKGNADAYWQALMDDEAGHGINAVEISKMHQPVLVRVFPESAIAGIDDPGAASNDKTGAELSDSEQAQTDAKKLDESVLTQYQGGDINSAANAGFVRAFVGAMGGSKAVGNMQLKGGLISASGIKRIEGALVAKAYGDDATLTDLTESPDSELKSLGDVLKDVAGRWAVMKQSAQDGRISQAMDITPFLNEAVAMVRKARQQGVRISELVNQNDMFSGQTNPVTESLLRLMFRGDDFNRVRSADKIRVALHGFIDRAMETTDGADMFGHVADPMALIDQQKGKLEADETAAKAQKGLFDSAIADYFNDAADSCDAEWLCSDDFEHDIQLMLDSATLSLAERRKITRELLAGAAKLKESGLSFMDRRKVTREVLDNVRKLGGQIRVEKSPKAKILESAVSLVRNSYTAMLQIKKNSLDEMTSWSPDYSKSGNDAGFAEIVDGAVIDALDAPELQATALELMDEMPRRDFRASVYSALVAEADAMQEKPKAEAIPEPEKQAESLDDRIKAAQDAGVILSEGDIDLMRTMHSAAAKQYAKANGNSSDAYLNELGRNFHLGMVGGSGRNVASLNRKREAAMDRSIDKAKENLVLYASADAKIRDIENMLQGKGAEKDIADKAAKKDKTKRELAQMAITLKAGDLIAGKTVVRVTNDSDGYPSKVRYVDPQAVDPIIEFWRIAFSSKDEFKGYVDRARVEAQPVEPPAPQLVRLTIPAIYTHDFHQSMMQSIYDNDGLVSVDDVRSAFHKIAATPDETKEKLAKLKNKELEGIASLAYRNQKKDDLVRGAYSRMLSEFAYFNGDTLSFGFGKGEQEKAVKARVDSLTQSDLIKWAAETKKRRQEHRDRIAAVKQAIADPQTLEDFDYFFRFKGKDKLTPEQLARYDALKAESGIATKEAQQEAKKEQAATVQGADTAIAHEFAETTHSKKGTPLFVVKLKGDRLDKDAFLELSRKAKKLGGWYSSFKGAGAIPGFQFTSETDRATFAKLLQGESVDVAHKIEEREAEKQDNRASKLLEMADKLEAKANEQLGRDRLSNTSRRAGMAANAINAAHEDLAFAKTIRAIAEKIQGGEVRFIANLSQKTQLATLNKILGNASYKYIDKGIRDGTISKGRDAVESRRAFTEEFTNGGATLEQMNELMATVKMPMPQLTPWELLKLADKVSGIDGLKLVSGRLLKLAGGSRSDDWKDAVNIPIDIAEKLVDADAQNKNRPYHQKTFELRWSVASGLDDYKRLARMGIETDEHLRMALREVIALKAPKQKEDPLKVLERNLIGKHKDLEWYNTPTEAAREVIRLAHLSPAHRILEPSAGFGHLADAALSIGIQKENIDTIEMSSELADALRLKGYNVVHQGDFLQYHKGGYDRIIMNPPFSADKDIQHVLHAYSLLKPGGRLVAIVSSMAGDRQNKTNQSFREFLDDNGIHEEALPEGSFKSSVNSTGVNTKIVMLEKKAPAVVEEEEPSGEGVDTESSESDEIWNAAKSENSLSWMGDESKGEMSILDSKNNTYLVGFGGNLKAVFKRINGEMRKVKLNESPEATFDAFANGGNISVWSVSVAATGAAYTIGEINTDTLEFIRDESRSTSAKPNSPYSSFAGFKLNEPMDEGETTKPTSDPLAEASKPKATDTPSLLPTTEAEDGLSDDPNSPNYRYKDTGYIAGSRKEEAAGMIRRAGREGRMLRATDIDFDTIEENPREAEELITKGNLFGSSDFEAMQESGMEAGAGFLVDKLYSAIGTKPAMDTAQARKDFAIGLESIRDRLEGKKTVAEVCDVINEIRDEGVFEKASKNDMLLDSIFGGITESINEPSTKYVRTWRVVAA